MTDTTDTPRSGSLLLGIVWILLGIVAITHPVGASIAVTKLTGWCLMIGGAVSLVAGATNRTQGNKWWPIIIGAIMGLVGYDLVFKPLEGTITLTFLVVIWMVIDGLLGVTAAISMRKTVDSWKWALGSSLATAALGVALWQDFPTSASWLLGVYAGIALVLRGVVSIMMRQAVA